MRIEEALANHRREVERRKAEEDELKERKQRQAEKSKRWEMLRWIVSFIEEKKPEWERRRKDQLAVKRRLEQNEKIRLEDYKRRPSISGEDKDERRRIMAKERAKNWKIWRGVCEEEDQE